MKRVAPLGAILLGLVIALGATPAYAADPGGRAVDPQVVAMLEEVPGGIVIDATHAVWPELDMELSVSSASGISARSVGACATGKFCAFNATSIGGSVLSFSTCGVNAIPSSFSVKSVANARTSGSLQARNGTTVLKTVSAGSWSNVTGTVTNLRCLL